MKEKMKMKTKYRIKLYNDFTEPYWKVDNPETSPIVNHKLVDEYVTYNENAFRSILDDFIDAPNKKLTDKDIRKDFDENRKNRMSDNKVCEIKRYYNGRYDLKKKICNDLSKNDAKYIKIGFPVILKYCIPFEMNYYSCEDNDPCDKLTKMNDAYIEIEISKEN